MDVSEKYVETLVKILLIEDEVLMGYKNTDQNITHGVTSPPAGR